MSGDNTFLRAMVVRVMPHCITTSNKKQYVIGVILAIVKGSGMRFELQIILSFLKGLMKMLNVFIL